MSGVGEGVDDFFWCDALCKRILVCTMYTYLHIPAPVCTACTCINNVRLCMYNIACSSVRVRP